MAGRFNPNGEEKWKFLPAVASLAAPTRPEITAGTDLTADLSKITGFNLKNTPYKTPDVNSTYISEVPGDNSSDNSSLEFWDRDDAATIRAALPLGTNGYIVRFNYGDVATKRCEVFPVTVSSQSTVPTARAAAAFVVDFSIHAPGPNLNAVVPA